jgi:hypothetical protein
LPFCGSSLVFSLSFFPEISTSFMPSTFQIISSYLPRKLTITFTTKYGLCSELLGFWAFPTFQYSKNGIYFCPQVRGKAPTQLGPLKS